MSSSLSTLIDAPVKRQTCQVRINGNTRADIIDISFTATINDTLAQCTLKTITNPNVNPEDKIQVSLGFNGSNQIIFSGLVDDVQYNEYEETYSIVSRDVLKKMMDSYLVQEIKFGLDANTGLIYYSIYNGSVFQEFEYSDFSSLFAAHPETNGNITDQGVKAEALITWLLQMSGLTNIQVDTTNFFVGDLNPVTFHLTSIYDAAMQVANLIGWRLYADAAGIVHFKKRPRNASGYTQWTYTDKGDPYNILKVSKTSSSTDLRNYVEIGGYSGIKYVARADSPFVKASTYRGVLISNELIDTQGMAEFMGNRVLNDLNRLKDSIDLEVGGNPLLYPGCSIKIKSRVAGGTFLVEDVQHTMNAQEYKTHIKASVFPGDASFVEDKPAIVAAFVPTQLAGIGDPKYMVQFDGSPSYSNRGQIVQWSWSWPNNTVYTANIPQAWYTFDITEITAGASGIVRLTVQDTMGNTATTSSGITLQGLITATPVKYRQIYAALTTEGVGSLDCGLTWNSIPVPAVSTAASNFMNNGVYTVSGYALFGTNTGQVVKTNDCCVTYHTVLSSTGVFEDVHIPELDGNYALAAVNNGSVGTLYRSQDLGESWTALSTFSVPIRECRFDYTNYSHIIVVCSGVNNIFESFDAGIHWIRDSFGVDTLWNDSGALTNYYAHSSGIISVSGVTPIPVLGTSSYQTSMTIKTDNDTGIMSVDKTGQHWVYSGAGMIQTQYNPMNTTQHMIRDGELPVVYYAVTSGVGKSLDFNYTMSGLYTPGGGIYGEMVAYGPLAELIRGNFFLFVMDPALSNNVDQGAYNNYQSNGRGVFIVDKDFTHWKKLLDGHFSMFALRPGLITVVDPSGTFGDSIHAIEIAGTTSSGVMSASGIAAYRDWYISPSGSNLEAVYESRVSTNLYAVQRSINGSSQQVRTALTFPSAPGSNVVSTMADLIPHLSQPIADASFNGWAIGGADDRVFYTRHPTIGTKHFYDADLKNQTYVDWTAPSGDFIIQNWIKFPGVFNTVALNAQDNMFYVLSGIGTATPMNIQRDEILKNIFEVETNSPTFIAGSQWRAFFDSGFNKTSVYYGTPSGVFRINSYGLGVSEQLYTCASGHYLRTMWVTHDTFDIVDFITVWEVRPDQQNRVNLASGIARELIVCSVDNGENWFDGPDTPHFLAGGTNEIVAYLDNPKTTIF